MQYEKRYANWLLHSRDGDDPHRKQSILNTLEIIRERVLTNANLHEGETLLDIGTGEGFIGFEALNRLGLNGHVVFQDISPDLIETCHNQAIEKGVVEQCSFITSSAEDLSALQDNAVDIVTARSVLAYVQDRQKAISEFYRVMRPSGRLSIFEPVTSFGYTPQSYVFSGYDVPAKIQTEATKIMNAFWELTAEEFKAVISYKADDLISETESAGFASVKLISSYRIERNAPQDWAWFYTTSRNPLVPSMMEAVEQALNVKERDRFEQCLRPVVEHGNGTKRLAVAYLSARKE